MYKLLFLTLLYFALADALCAQDMHVEGTVEDTASKVPVKNAVIIAVRVKDSILIAHTRSNSKGFFTLDHLPVDTLEILISAAQFGDRSYFLFGSAGNKVFDFGRVILPLKSNQLKEVVIYATKDPVYFNGDTLVYTAAAYKLKQNATVEDLLKKLPGIKVDEKGKITAQGKDISQVLVDGDEFFGSDPTVATKNLAAGAVESVQVYEKKNEAAGSNTDETIQVMNLKLKEDSKNGYFGKMAGGTDFNRFYEGQALVNKFTNTQKLSVFALTTNTPVSGFDGGDVYKYGLDNEGAYVMTDDGNFSFGNGNRQKQGIPKTTKGGFYYNDRLSKKTKVGFNYTYTNNELKMNSSTRSAYFLTDTSYTTDNKSTFQQHARSHQFNFKLTQTLDSLTTLEVEPKVKLSNNQQHNYQFTQFINAREMLVNETQILNTSKTEAYDVNTSARLMRKFKKPERSLYVTGNFVVVNEEGEGLLKSTGIELQPGSKDTIDQQKTAVNNNLAQNLSVFYIEPLTKKIKLGFEYNFDNSKGRQNKVSKNFVNGQYTEVDPLLTNDFESHRMINRLGAKFIVETKKTRSYLGVYLRNMDNTYINRIDQVKTLQSINNLLPYFNYTYSFTQGTRFYFNYKTSSEQPTIIQLQPVPDNTNPNQIRIGNPKLKPTFNNKFNLSLQSFKPISGQYMMSSVSFSTVANAFGNSIAYDHFGRMESQVLNISGNYNGSGSIRGSIPLFSKKLKIDPDLSYTYNKYSSYINTKKNTTKTGLTQLGLSLGLHLDSLDFNLGYSYSHTATFATITQLANQAYPQHNYNASLDILLPHKFSFETDANYFVNSQRSAGYNLRYLVWNASINKSFLKKENLIVSLSCHDLLNQNIATSRTVEDNVIIDKKTDIVSRYFLLTLTCKFNSSHTKTGEDDF
jgi:hypothetical protein